MSNTEEMTQLVCESGVKMFVPRVLEWREYHFRGSLKAGLTSRV